MERQESIAIIPFKEYRANTGALTIFIIILFHLAGLTGIAFSACRPLFLTVVPAHLLLMFILILINHRELNKRFFGFIALIFLSGFAAEWTGVHTNLLFGHYYYGKTLNLTIFGIPLVMGINWFLLIYITGAFTRKIKIQNSWMRVITGTFILVTLDLLIEPVAMRLDYWHWQQNKIPAMNYGCWFLLSFVMLYLFERFEFKTQNWSAPVLLLSQFVFFAVLNFLI